MEESSLYSLAHLHKAIVSGDFQSLDAYPPISHVMKILAPFSKGLVLSAGGFLPFNAADQTDRNGHHQSGRKIKFINELAPIRYFDNWSSHRNLFFCACYIDWLTA